MEKNRAEITAEQIYQEVMSAHNNSPTGLVILNRAISFDFARLFKETSMDYAGNCLLLERLYHRSDCKERDVPVQKLPDEAMEIKADILSLVQEAVEADKEGVDVTDILDKIDAMEQKLSEFELEDSVVKMLTYRPFDEEFNQVVVLDLADKSMSIKQYQSFCSQIAFFAYNYFAAMLMIPPNSINISVKTVEAPTYIDIVCTIE